jgi:NAD(P)-dependent dehydrogenase (short-subunit alcohol dehydrogenase family)
MATIWGIEIFGPLIEQHGEGGHIVSLASIAGLVSGQSGPYNVSKQANDPEGVAFAYDVLE